jgi:hypothetical protein
MENYIIIGTISVTKDDEQIKFQFSPSASFAQLKKKHKQSLLLDFCLFLAELSKDYDFMKPKRNRDDV